MNILTATSYNETWSTDDTAFDPSQLQWDEEQEDIVLVINDKANLDDSNDDNVNNQFVYYDEKDEDDSAMSPSQRYVLSEQQLLIGQLPPPATAVKATVRRKKRLGANKINQQSLNELDETVASVGKMYRSPRRPGEEDGSVVSNGSHSIDTRDGNTIYTQPNLIVNMQYMNSRTNGLCTNGGVCHSVQSMPSKSRASRASKKSKKKRRARGSSLERTISETILATQGVEGAIEMPHNIYSANVSFETTSTEFILHDLDQVSTIIEGETASQACGSPNGAPASPLQESAARHQRNRYAPSPLLPPIASESYLTHDDDQVVDEAYFQSNGTGTESRDSERSNSTSSRKDETRDTVSFVKVQDLDFLTPTNSGESRGFSIEHPHHSPDEPFYTESELDPFEAIDRKGIKSLWEASVRFDMRRQPSNGEQEPVPNARRTRGPQSRIQSSMRSGTKRGAIHQSPNSDLLQEMGFLDSEDGWTTFNDNPFSNFDTASIESPNSIAEFGEHADFTHIRAWKKSETGWKTTSKVFI